MTCCCRGAAWVVRQWHIPLWQYMLSGQRNNWVQQQAVRAGHPARNQRRQGTPGIAGAAPAGRQYSNHAATSNRRPQSLPARRQGHRGRHHGQQTHRDLIQHEEQQGLKHGGHSGQHEQRTRAERCAQPCHVWLLPAHCRWHPGLLPGLACCHQPRHVRHAAAAPSAARRSRLVGPCRPAGPVRDLRRACAGLSASSPSPPDLSQSNLHPRRGSATRRLPRPGDERPKLLRLMLVRRLRGRHSQAWHHCLCLAGHPVGGCALSARVSVSISVPSRPMLEWL
mmetsp:Transcript_24536/g.72715  ORF Transcript_24536/g.72715 Transcript_24536/m.72715 type:complete len:281 (-) Transcript_24536:90-932(-)